MRDGDEDAQRRALRCLWSAVLHQGTLATVTPFVVRALCDLLDEASPLPPDIRTEVLEFLGAVA